MPFLNLVRPFKRRMIARLLLSGAAALSQVLATVDMPCGRKMIGRASVFVILIFDQVARYNQSKLGQPIDDY
ncbi:hypothetical protein [Pseudomonas sp. AD21]|jgi:hypothetical protein|uniref:hypothetical protein n=1 Tax=Pseudomonas sp. AD21 TaxID=396378 RepID=UPI0011AF1A58|nr:hypothetical protein [Pseudomonas sp. AD21]